MQSLKFYCFLNRISLNSFSRQIQTNSVLMTRFQKKNARHRIKSHAGFMKSLREGDEKNEDLEELDDDSEDFNFMEADAAYDEYDSEQKHSRKKLGKILTAKKFFEPRKEPRMLTYAEQECIRYLHNKDPDHWDIETLSENFPATTDIIKKVLKAKWQCSPEKQKIFDSRVQKNWELLARGNLDADPKLIQHLKKFINRRQAVLDQLQSNTFYLPDKKPKQVWNMGEMSAILHEYEKAIKQLSEPQLVEATGSSSLKTNVEKTPISAIKEESSLEVMREKINEIASIRNLEGAESFLLKQMINRYQKKLTLEELEQSVVNKADANKQLDWQEKAILESKLAIQKSDSVKKDQPSSQCELKERKHQKFLKKLIEKETTVSIAETNQNENENFEMNNNSQFSRIKSPEKFSAPDENLFSVPEPDENTILVSECDLGETLAEKTRLKSSSTQENDVPKGKKSMRKNKVLDEEAQKRQDLFFEKQVEDIKSTAFWNDCNDSKSKALTELKKEPLGPLKDYDKVSLADVSIENDYPNRIKIPDHKKGSGLTFKVRDCYYDDDGEFLYRVPGITK